MNDLGRMSVLGCGRWGSFHLWYGSRCGLAVTGWEPGDSEPFRMLAERRANRHLALPDDVTLTTDLDSALETDILVIATPSSELGGLCSVLRGRDLSRIHMILCMKGLEKGTGRRLSEIVRAGGLEPASLSAWVGPGHPSLLAAGQPTCMLIASDDDESSTLLADRLGSRLVRLYRSADMTGCELGAASKNVVGIAAGLLDGLGWQGLKGALMARAPLEVARLVTALGGDWRSVFGLSHLGDYEATLFSSLSRNRLMGECLATGRPYTEGLAEGVETCGALLLLASRTGVEMPITGAVERVLNGSTCPAEAVAGLFERPMKDEFPRSAGGAL